MWKDKVFTCKEPLNPYSMTLKQGLQNIKDKLQKQEHFSGGKDELIVFECFYDKCNPRIPSQVSDQVLLHDIYKHVHHYPRIQVTWEIKCVFMVPYERTIGVERTSIPEYKNNDVIYKSNEKYNFNPFLYETDLHKLKLMQDKIYSNWTSANNEMKKLLHEVIKNGFLWDLYGGNLLNTPENEEKIKKEVQYNEKEPDQLILNDKTLTIIKHVRHLFHSKTHKHMGYPLRLVDICAILLYCGKSCNVTFSSDQIRYNHHKWVYLDSYLCNAIRI